ncbi:MAG TPA: fumarylacetoacetate hydrolase family protein [Pirellulales bacterium]|jgi:2-dehydro-3-deoxy-D-arabinonate dehydratase|nr:fumarylacetoacetate hydrolase family protein [Pirellulales bacterium]
MKLAKFRNSSGSVAIGVLEGEHIRPIDAGASLAEVLEQPKPAAWVEQRLTGNRLALADVTLLAPVDRQEIWAAGVTYRRSKSARMEESVGAAVFYDKVYEAERPELFFKANAWRVIGPGGPVRIRRDSRWNVPEPELALVLNSRLELVAFTIGNDMSSRDIEGENPLYLPQAKVYDGSCAMGPCMALAAAMPPADKIGIRLAIAREGREVFAGQTSVGQMARSFADLIEYLGRDHSFPDGACLLTGTGIVPGADFTLAAGDVVRIEIDGIGELVNPVA